MLKIQSIDKRTSLSIPCLTRIRKAQEFIPHISQSGSEWGSPGSNICRGIIPLTRLIWSEALVKPMWLLDGQDDSLGKMSKCGDTSSWVFGDTWHGVTSGMWNLLMRLAGCGALQFCVQMGTRDATSTHDFWLASATKVGQKLRWIAKVQDWCDRSPE